MKQTIVFATSNPNKVKEVREILTPYHYEILSLNDVNLEVTHPEDGETFLDNAMIKAREISSKTNLPVISDDSGLVIDALDGFPGVHSARFMEGASYEEKNKKILEMMQGKENRKVRFVAALVYIDREAGVEKSFSGVSEGEIATSLDEHPLSGFGYDPIFYSYDLKKTFSQCSSEEKDRVSHRGRALMAFVSYLKENSEL